jgi:hypothetical protein
MIAAQPRLALVCECARIRYAGAAQYRDSGIGRFLVKKTLLAAGFLFCAFATGATAEEAKQDFKLINKTGYELKELYVSPSKASDWQDDVLGQATLGDGQFANVHFHRAATACKWDLKVVYSVDSSSAVWSDIDLCTVEAITLHYDKDADKTTATFD